MPSQARRGRLHEPRDTERSDPMTYTPPGNDDPSGDESEQSYGWRKRLEDENASMAKELDSLKRERAFEQAGLDLSNPMASYFMKGYDGDPNPEAIKAEATRAGLLSSEPKVPPSELAEHQAAAHLPSGTGVITPDPTLPKFADPAYQAEYHEALSRARNQDEVLGVMADFGSPTQILEDWE